MELLQLKYFADAAECENFSQTAMKFSVPPSDISQSIKRLEDEIGVKLFDRSANRITLNEKGNLYYKSVKSALDTLENAVLRIKDNSQSGGKIKLLIKTNRRIVTDVAKNFNTIYPNVTVYMNNSKKGGYGEYDLIITDELIDNENLSRETLIDEKIMLAVADSNPLCKKKKIKISDLKDSGFIIFDEQSVLQKKVNRLFEDEGITQNVIIQCDDPYYVRKYVSLGLGIAFVPTLSWKGLFEKNVRLINAGDITRKTYLYRDRRKYTSDALAAFVSMLEKKALSDSAGSVR